MHYIRFSSVCVYGVKSNTLWKNSYHGSGVNIGRRMNIDITWGNEKYKYTCFCQYEEVTKLKKVKSYHLFWALPPYLRPIFQDELCDTD